MYELSRKFIYRMHLKREKIYKELDDKHWNGYYNNNCTLQKFKCYWLCQPFLNFAFCAKINNNNKFVNPKTDKNVGGSSLWKGRLHHLRPEGGGGDCLQQKKLGVWKYLFKV